MRIRFLRLDSGVSDRLASSVSQSTRSDRCIKFCIIRSISRLQKVVIVGLVVETSIFMLESVSDMKSKGIISI